MLEKINHINDLSKEVEELSNAQFTNLKVICEKLEDFRPLVLREMQSANYSEDFDATEFCGEPFTFYIYYRYNKGFYVQGDDGDGELTLKEYIQYFDREEGYTKYALIKDFYLSLSEMLGDIEDSLVSKVEHLMKMYSDE